MSSSALPRIVVLADRDGSELLPLTRDTPVALLSVATRPLLDLCMESLLPMAPGEFDLVICSHSDQIRQHVERNRAWGLQPRYVLSQGDEAPAGVLRRAGSPLAGDYLVVRADMLRVGDISAFLQAARQIPDGLVTATADGKPAGLWYCSSANELGGIPGWPLDSHCASPLQLAQSHCDALADLGAFHHSNMQAGSGQISGLQRPGRDAGNGLWLGRNARCAVQPQDASSVVLGTRAQVLKDVALSGNVLIGDDAIVDRDSQLEDSVILPHSYIGPGVELRRAIVSGNTLIRPDSGSAVTVVDAFLLADLKHADLPTRIAAPLHRLAGFILLILSAPLWPLAAFMAWRQHPSEPVVAFEFLGTPPTSMAGAVKRQRYSGWHWNTQVPVLRALPELLALLRGQLHLFGTAPLKPDEADSRKQAWQHLTDEAPAGLIGPTQLLLRPDDPLEERLLSDAFYVRQRSLRGDFQLLLRACLNLLSARAWRRNERP